MGSGRRGPGAVAVAGTHHAVQQAVEPRRRLRLGAHHLLHVPPQRHPRQQPRRLLVRLRYAKLVTSQARFKTRTSACNLTLKAAMATGAIQAHD